MGNIHTSKKEVKKHQKRRKNKKTQDKKFIVRTGHASGPLKGNGGSGVYPIPAWFQAGKKESN
jgi:hypothetical protein